MLTSTQNSSPSNSNFLCRSTYKQIGERNAADKSIKNVLDIGTATGGPLSTIVHYFEQARILGIDYNEHYVPHCEKLFEDHSHVEIKHMNFYDLEREEPDTMFDIIIFGSSFMILPDQVKALEIARSTSFVIQESSPKTEKFTFCLLFMKNEIYSQEWWSSLSLYWSICAQSISEKPPTEKILKPSLRSTVCAPILARDVMEISSLKWLPFIFTKLRNVDFVWIYSKLLSLSWFFIKYPTNYHKLQIEKRAAGFQPPAAHW